MSLENVANDTYDLLGKIMNLDEATRRKIADYLLTHKDLAELQRKAELWDKVKGLECENCPLEEDCYADGNDHRRCPVNKIIDALEGDNE